jgi:post-segregation antitoxin (ccd killing protein)
MNAAMDKMLRLTVTALVFAFVMCPIKASTQTVATGIELNDKNVEGFIAAQKDMSAVAEKMLATAFLNQADAKYRKEREVIAKRYGFADFAEYKAVANIISWVMTSMDSKTKEYVDPQTAIKQEIENIRTDKTIPNREKKELLAELDTALTAVASIQFPGNIELVKKYYEKIDVTTVLAIEDDDGLQSRVARTISE